MLDKLSLSKFLLFLSLLFSSCSKPDVAPGVYHTEVICPNKAVILVRFVALKDVRKAIEEAHVKRMNYDSNENYTILAFGKNISVKLDEILPETAMQCQLRELYDPRPDPNMAKYLDPANYRAWSAIN